MFKILIISTSIISKVIKSDLASGSFSQKLGFTMRFLQKKGFHLTIESRSAVENMKMNCLLCYIYL
ncbi:MAG TPA: hypothetical protein PLE33_03960 [Candidatus Cloacimonas sp.]|nr:hypothetical protein [Candidatus Cloacimonas sp.]HPS60399.1 hypothetical protein [Candidatus Cloacimonas sp.]